MTVFAATRSIATLLTLGLSLAIPAVGWAQESKASDRVEDAGPALLPAPASSASLPGELRIGSALAIALPPGDAGARSGADYLIGLLQRSGLASARIARGSAALRFVRKPGMEPEEFALEVTPQGATISATGDAGMFYGGIAFWQLLGASNNSTIAAVRIVDRPAHAWRGVMLDSARHMQSVEFIYELIDRMAQVRLNRLHWHLTDDQGWRFPVASYPRLTSAGAWRIEPGEGGQRYGGFYTAAQIRAIVAYAARRHIEIVPEIDVPGHATAAIAAYPWLASTPNPPAMPSHDWGILPNLIVPDARGQKFVEDVLDEVFRLFPGRYVHIGGDEAVKDQWKANPAVQTQMRKLGLASENALQSWFVSRIADYAARHGRRVIGWDEILDGPVPGDAMVMSWRGTAGALKAAQAGHDAILAPAPDFYLDNRQSASDREPPGRGEIVSWRRIYEFDPGLGALNAVERGRVAGMQVNLWTEHVRTDSFARSMIWPRAAILAEIAWSGRRSSWQEFAPRLVTQLQRDRKMRQGSNEISLQPLARFSGGNDGQVTVSLSQPAAIGELRYSLDGSAPGPRSPAYVAPLAIAPGRSITVAPFLDGRPIAPPTTWRITAGAAWTMAGNDMETCDRGIVLRMEDPAPTGGVRKAHLADLFNTCWIWRRVNLDGARAIRAGVGSRPFNFSLGHEIERVKLGETTSSSGEMKVRLGSCEGPVVATLPLEPLRGHRGVGEVSGNFDRALSGQHDLCIILSRPRIDPMWLLDRVTLSQ